MDKITKKFIYPSKFYIAARFKWYHILSWTLYTLRFTDDPVWQFIMSRDRITTCSAFRSSLELICHAVWCSKSAVLWDVMPHQLVNVTSHRGVTPHKTWIVVNTAW